jgi:DNA-binding GntR family transcriptional regulator
MVGEQEAVEILQARAVLEALAARAAAQRARAADVAALRAILAVMRERLDGGDLLGASERDAALHARILALSGHRTAGRLVASLNSQLVRFQYRTILVWVARSAPTRSTRRSSRRSRPATRTPPRRRCAAISSTSPARSGPRRGRVSGARSARHG